MTETKFTRQDYEKARSDVEKTAREIVVTMRGRIGFDRWPQYVQAPLIRLKNDLAYLDKVAGQK